MDNLIFSLNATLPIFILMMVGWAFRQCGIISESFGSQMNSFVFKIALPVNLFTQLCDVDIRSVWDTGYVVFCFLATLASILIGAAVSRLCAAKEDRAEFVQGAYRSSASLLGMTYIELIYGKATMGSLMMIGCVPLYNVAAVIVLSAGQGRSAGAADIRKTLVKIITNPIILGILAGFAWSLLGIGMPTFLDTSLDYIGRLASPMGLLAMGAALDFKKMFGKIGPAIVGSALKLVGFAALFVPIAVRLGFTNEKLVAALIMLASPSTVAGYIMAKNMGHDGTLSASMVMITTVFSSLTLTLWLWILRSRGLV